MSTTVVVGAQWGDEGKGKIVDYLALNADVVARYGGGANAGHTLKAGDINFVTHLLPSGVLNPGTFNLIGNGVVVDPVQVISEMEECRGLGVEVSPRNFGISDRAHVVFPYHKERDVENEKTKNAVGSTKRGIGPTYTDKAFRSGVQMWELADPSQLRQKLGGKVDRSTLDEYLRLGSVLKPYLCDASMVANRAIDNKKTLLIEGAQGVLLDIDHGTYPFVTSSATTAGGACTGLGIGPTKIERVIGVAKAYTTRVGEGPFPTELTHEAGDFIRDIGNEYGATTGRPRKCGWLDLVALKHAVRVGGITELAITKLDVLSELGPLSVCIEYVTPSGKSIDTFPPNLPYMRVEPKYVEMKGFGVSRHQLSKSQCLTDLPRTAQYYLGFISHYVGVPINIISVGPNRMETIVK